jgi:hypothetical protein
MKLIILAILIVSITGCTVIHQWYGPPSHAKAYGHYKKYAYHYYPNLEIYWYPETKTYIVLRSGVWVEIETRPAILTPAYSYVVIKTETSKPWLKHSYYKKKYPPGQLKKKGKYKGKKKKW